MKSRSHRLSVSESHDDWVDGSWTVDCVCGVNFDDGEEMVDCDECGVWVHTRCSRYVKSEKSFACDKCKNKNSGNGGIGDDSEETEVAEFLLELPTKTLGMNHPNQASISYGGPASLWANIPMEERVHVQGIPGGDPGLFSGISTLSVIGPQLWKSTGYVPKKLNFRYHEFAEWDDGVVEEKKEDLIDNSAELDDEQVNKEAVALLCLSKDNENNFNVPLSDEMGVKNKIEDVGCNKLASPSHRKKLDGENQDFALSHNSLEEKISVQPILLHCANRKKEPFEISKDQSGKKRGKTQDEEEYIKKQSPRFSEEVSLFSTDAKKLESFQDKRLKVVNNGIHCDKDVLTDQRFEFGNEGNTHLVSNQPCAETIPRNELSSDGLKMEGDKGNQASARSERLPISSNGVTLSTEPNGSAHQPAKEEVRDALQSRPAIGFGTGRGEYGTQDYDSLVKSKECKGAQDSNVSEPISLPKKKLETEFEVNDCGVAAQSIPLNGVALKTVKAANQLPESSAKIYSENFKMKISDICSETSDFKGHDGSRSLNVGTLTTDTPGDPYQSMRESTGPEGFVEAKRKPSEHSNNLEEVKEMVKESHLVTKHFPSSQRKGTVSVGKSTSTTFGLSSKLSDNCVPTVQNPTIDSSRQKNSTDIAVETVKEIVTSDKSRDVGKCTKSKKVVKESSRLMSTSETSQAAKLSHPSDFKRSPSSDSKDSTVRSTSKLSSAPDVTVTPGCGELVIPSQSDEASNVRNNSSGSVVTGKVDKFYHSSGHLSSKANTSLISAPPSSNVPAGLSDEELALLLHQELNSSPRVPRVPRMRHTGSLPHLGSSTASSMLMKRTSSGGGKDHGMLSKRKTKDFPRDGSHRTMERLDEAKRMGRKPSSPDSKRRYSGCSVDRLPRGEANDGFVKGVHAGKVANLSSSLSSSGDVNEHHVSSSHPSFRKPSDDGSQMTGRITNHTLPGLIAEIMSEGKRMTYEELCNAVLPHWPHLRKHNGERYAYSSHSQAVLDCLRNRSEWARLVDRGPKTSGSRKRRKHDADSGSAESEDSRYKNSKDIGFKSFESQQGEFPKGKRNARKRKCLTSQGRSVRSRRADVVSDDESESFSDSSEETISSEEEIQGGRTSSVGNETSSSSEEVL